MHPDEPLRVVVADDHPIYREGVVEALRRAGIDVVGVCSRGDEVVEAVQRLRPAVAVIDQRMPGADAVAIVEQLAADRSPTRVLVLSAFVESEIVIRTLTAGAAGYLAKESPRDAICDAVRAIAAGGSVVGPELQAGLVDQIRQRAAGPQLSEREAQILRLLAQGMSGPQIAERLIIGRATVKTHLHNLYDKLGVADRASAVAEGIRRGLID